MTDSKKICLWCGESTEEGSVKVESKGEHVFPEAIGGKIYLPVGSVCKSCNNSFSEIDRELRYGHPAMMCAYQKDPKITGKKISGKSKKKLDKKARRSLEKNEVIKGSDGSLILRDQEKNRSKFYKANYRVASEKFLRSLHKCLLNIICYEIGAYKTRLLYPELIEYVKDGGQKGLWTYAISVSNFFNNILVSSPEPIFKLKKKNSNHLIIGFMHTSGIWVTGTEPSSINAESIKELADMMHSFTQEHFDINPRISRKVKRKAKEHFGFKVQNCEIGIGELNFYIGVET